MVGLAIGIWSNQGLGLHFETQINKIMEKTKTKDVVWDDLRTVMNPEKSYEQLRPRSVDW